MIARSLQLATTSPRTDLCRPGRLLRGQPRLIPAHDVITPLAGRENGISAATPVTASARAGAGARARPVPGRAVATGHRASRRLGCGQAGGARRPRHRPEVMPSQAASGCHIHFPPTFTT